MAVDGPVQANDIILRRTTRVQLTDRRQLPTTHRVLLARRIGDCVHDASVAHTNKGWHELRRCLEIEHTFDTNRPLRQEPCAGQAPAPPAVTDSALKYRIASPGRRLVSVWSHDRSRRFRKPYGGGSRRTAADV